ncbi:MAG: PAS domain S-box protein, partial [Ginsengibacter sp.]
ERNFQVLKFIRDVCVFSKHNMVSDPPFSKMDIVSCQNVLIYFEPVLQEKMLKIFHYSLKPAGYLFLGKSETISNNADLFQQADKEQKVYTKKNGTGHYNFDFSYTINGARKPLPPETNVLNKDKASDADVERMSDNILLSRYVPASVLVNSDLLIIRFHGATSRFLQPSRGKASLNLLKMLHEDLVLELRSLIYKARKEKAPVQLNGVLLNYDKYTETVNLEVIPLHMSTAEPYFLILFKEAASKHGHVKGADQLQAETKGAENARIASLEDELRGLKEQIAGMSDEFEATREELQTANEEVLSSNEELQSINEELETSREELQSINEELQLRNSELNEAFEYRQAIVETIREPLVVLTTDLRVSSANRAFYTHFHQERAETEGFYIFEMKNGKWKIPKLKEQLLEVISKNKTLENFEVHHEFPAIGERDMLFSALRMRYNHNQQNRILLVIEDITERREAENKLIQSVKLNTTILNSISDIFISVNNKWDITYINPKGESFTGKKSGEIIGKNLWDVLTSYIATDFQKKLVSAMKSKSFSRFEYYDEKEQEWYDFRLYPSEETLSLYGSRISEQKKAQQLLEESKKRYELFITQSSEGIWRFELREPVSTELSADEQIENWFQNAFVAECNDAMAKMYGYHKAKELEGVPLKEVLQQNEKNLGTLKAFIESGYRINEAETLYKKDDRVVYFVNNMVGITKDKKLISIWGTKQDVTSKKNIEQTLLKTRQQLNFALAAGSVGTYVWDFKTNKIKWTKVQESLYGLKEYSFKGTLDDWMSFIHPDDVTCTRKAIEEAIHSHRELAVEFRIRWPDNSLHWILSRASTTYDTEGNPVEMMGVNIDISDRKMQEQLVQENEERFKALVQNSFDVITVFNIDGTITYQSESIERVLGYKASDRIGKNLFDDSVVHPEDREIEKKLFEKCIDHPYQYMESEFRMMHKNGNYCIMEVGCINLLQNSSIHGIIKNYRDVTERRAIEKQKEEFIGIASHELKTPVTSIKAYTQILHDTLVEKKDEASASLLLRMDHQIDRLTALIKDLLDVTKITEGQLVLKHEVFDINELVSEVTEDLQMTTQKHRIIKELGELKLWTGDKERTAQVLVNLLSNAIKYSPSADKVIVRTSSTENEVIVSVQDFGIGISKEMQKKLFTRFFRVTDETSSTFPGLGLGLFISTEIIRKQKGRIWVESAPNKGSTFSFTLPYHKE